MTTHYTQPLSTTAPFGSIHSDDGAINRQPSAASTKTYNNSINNSNHSYSVVKMSSKRHHHQQHCEDVGHSRPVQRTLVLTDSEDEAEEEIIPSYGRRHSMPSSYQSKRGSNRNSHRHHTNSPSTSSPTTDAGLRNRFQHLDEEIVVDDNNNAINVDDSTCRPRSFSGGSSYMRHGSSSNRRRRRTAMNYNSPLKHHHDNNEQQHEDEVGLPDTNLTPVSIPNEVNDDEAETHPTITTTPVRAFSCDDADMIVPHPRSAPPDHHREKVRRPRLNSWTRDRSSSLADPTSTTRTPPPREPPTARQHPQSENTTHRHRTPTPPPTPPEQQKQEEGDKVQEQQQAVEPRRRANSHSSSSASRRLSFSRMMRRNSKSSSSIGLEMATADVGGVGEQDEDTIIADDDTKSKKGGKEKRNKSKKMGSKNPQQQQHDGNVELADDDDDDTTTAAKFGKDTDSGHGSSDDLVSSSKTTLGADSELSDSASTSSQGLYGLKPNEEFYTGFLNWDGSAKELGYQRIPKGSLALCKLRRIRASGSSRFPCFALSMQTGDGNTERQILVARRQRHGKNISYLIATDARCYEGHMHSAKLKANFTGSRFVVYDDGFKTPQFGTNIIARKEIADITYLKKSWSHPRSLVVKIPQGQGEGQLGDMGAEDASRPYFMVNAMPEWDPELRVHSLKFNGRATEVSVKNFKLVEDGLSDKNHVDEKPFLLRLGKVAKNEFNLDFRYPLCPVQAMAIALSSFEGGRA